MDKERYIPYPFFPHSTEGSLPFFLLLGFVFEMEAIKRFLSSLSELVLCSLQFSESREVFEILQSTFEKILHTQVKRLYLG